MAQIQTLLDKLDYQFKDEQLLKEALSHRSSGSRNYERLEFLGDGFLNFTIATELYHQRTDEDEGALSRLRASLVRESTLAQIARELKLGDHLIMGVGELRSGGFKRDSILSDVVESIIGAVFIESGYECARSLVLRLYGNRIAELPPSAELKDPKTRLQEQLQAQGLGLPDYEVIETTGKAHDMRFTVRCKLHEPAIDITATATSKRKAEQQSATLMLDKIDALRRRPPA
ncbi:MAG: ribonuclease III [Granulosicoccus sp.]